MNYPVRRVFFQGRDYKAMQWTSHFSVPVHKFTTIKDMTCVLLELNRRDLLVFRYQNCPSRLAPTLAILFVFSLLIFKALVVRACIVWICHNVDRDTSPHFFFVQRIQRFLLQKAACRVFVLDQALKPNCVRKDAIAVSFGVKTNGKISESSVNLVEQLAGRHDKLVLIAGQDGGKYKSFARIPCLYRAFTKMGVTVGFVVAGMSQQRSFSSEIEQSLIRLNESNLDEVRLANFVDYIYRENEDLSVPYTAYAAATAHIPVITSPGNILAKIVTREKIGFTLDQLEASHDLHNSYDFDGFLRRHEWSSLKHSLIENGIVV